MLLRGKCTKMSKIGYYECFSDVVMFKFNFYNDENDNPRKEK